MRKKYYIIAGEASGDMYGASLVNAMIKLNPETEFRGFGGEKMKNAGVNITLGIDRLAIFGFFEVLLNFKRLLSYFTVAKKEILEFQPDAVIFIDYPGFNMRMAKWAKENHIKVYYYIAPKVWAWGKNRIETLKKYVDKLFLILPFEKEFFKKHGVDAVYVGNPLLEEINKYNFDPGFSLKHNIPSEKIKIAFFPGSRINELKKNIEPLVPLIRNSQNMIFLIAARSDVKFKKLKELKNYENVRIIYDQNYDILKLADAGIIKSGTASLEAVIFRLPHVVIYKTGLINQLIMEPIIRRLKFSSLVNLILDKMSVKELFQNRVNPYYVDMELQKTLEPVNRKRMLDDFDQCINSIMIKKYPSELVAEHILSDNLKI
ncbi:MAG: lipid-A-disaccharide synthase [Deltaproteobacteria bacterium]